MPGWWLKYSPEFRARALERLKSCDNVSSLARELKIPRKWLYLWRDRASGCADQLTAEDRELESISAKLATRRKDVRIVEGGARKPVTTPDQIAIAGTLQNGVIASIFYRGGISRGQNLRWEINGSHGDLVMTSSTGNIQGADLKLEGGPDSDTDVSAFDLDALGSSEPKDVAANVRRLYAALGQDIRDGGNTVPGFQHAARRHHLIEAIETAARTGIAQIP